ncbi:MAG: helix-turn-helix domain-containing protein [Adlercreutzia equolifaciens]
MARQTSFGEALAHARERKGLDLSTAARKLRIRPDILRAIEEGDFARMPPRGYTSNMVGAYARLVGLNPTEVTRAYREEKSTSSRRAAVRRATVASAPAMPDARSRCPPAATGILSGLLPRRLRAPRAPAVPAWRFLGLHGQGGSAAPVHQPRPRAPGTGHRGEHRLVFAAHHVGAIIVGLLVLVIVLAFGNRAAPESDVPTVPISGMQNPAGTDTGAANEGAGDATAPTQQPVAPTSAKFSYNVPEGSSVYIEVVQDGKTVEAGNVTGPKTADFDVTGTLKFVLSGDDEDIAAVKLTLDGEEVKAEDQNGRGVYTYTVNFEDVLNDWKRANGVAGASSDSSGDSDSGSSSGSDSSSDDSSTSDRPSDTSGNGDSSDSGEDSSDNAA